MPVSSLKFHFRSCAAARLLRDYLEFKATRGFTSYAGGRVYTARNFDRYLTEAAIADITQLDERLMLNWIYGQPTVSDRMKNSRIGFLRGFCGYLVRRKLLTCNFADRISLLKTPPPRKGTGS